CALHHAPDKSVLPTPRSEIRNLRNCWVLDTFYIYEHLPILPAARYETRWIRRQWSTALPLPPLSPRFHHPLQLRLFWVPLAPGRDLNGGEVVLQLATLSCSGGTAARRAEY